MPKRVDEVAQVEVGRFYMVPHVTVTSPAGRLRRSVTDRLYHYWRKPVPIIWPPHQDPEIDADYPHFHFDWRFMNVSLGKDDVLSVLQLTRVQEFFDAALLPNEIAMGRYDRLPLAWLKRKCRRQAKTFPRLFTHILEETCKGKFVGSDMRCPHKGICLKGHPRRGDEVVCPGHGLKWNLQTGRMVHRPNMMNEF